MMDYYTAIINIVAEVYLMVQKNTHDILVNSKVKTPCLVRIHLSRYLSIYLCTHLFI